MAGLCLLSPQRAVVGYAIAFIIGGFVAGLVAGEIRKHVEAEVHAAAIRREVDRLEHDLALARSIQQGLLPHTIPENSRFPDRWIEPACGSNWWRLL
jgi:hypothetical protein